MMDSKITNKKNISNNNKINTNNNNNYNNNNINNDNGTVATVIGWLHGHYQLIALLLFLFELVLNVSILKFVNYTEIDWVAYMEEVKGFMDGERDYMKLEGGTGPLVYPAGFVYLFSLLYLYVTDSGNDIFLAQCIFVGLYLAFILVVFAIYSKTKTPAYVMIFLCLSKRIHSIFVLRLFNDCFAMFFFYIALYLFMKHRWNWGSLFFTMAVSVKMNVLLYAPGLLYLLLRNFGLVQSLPKLAICGIFQVLVGAPFLLHSWTSYLVRSFDLGRQFFFKWTVNWRFVPEDIFLSKQFAASLLLLHVITLIVFAYRKWHKKYAITESLSETYNYRASNSISKTRKAATLTPDCIHCFIIHSSDNLIPKDIMLVMASSNFIGIVFARSLHYQFYVWYYHILPFLLWKTRLPIVLRIAILVAIEICWNVFPSTNWSSLLLVTCHFVLLVALYFGDFNPLSSSENRKDSPNKSKTN